MVLQDSSFCCFGKFTIKHLGKQEIVITWKNVFLIRMKEIKINNILEDAFSVDASGPGFGSIFLLND